MADDVERMLADLERRLHALQAELGHEPATRPQEHFASDIQRGCATLTAELGVAGDAY